MAQQITLETVVRFWDDEYPEDNRIYTISRCDYTESVQQAINDGYLQFDRDEIITWLTQEN